MKLTFFLTVFLFFAAYLPAQDIVLPLWSDGKVPNHKKSDEWIKIDSTDIIRISKVQSPDIAIYFPARRVATGQAVIICPGGGYNYLSYNWEGSDPARWFAVKGITAIVLKYRLPDPASNINPTLSPLMDAQRAIRMVRANAGKWNIKKDQIGIMGFSAGGHLASTAGTHFDNGKADAADSIERQSSRPDFLLLIYPVISMSKDIMHKGSRNRLIGEKADSSLAKLYSNELQVTKNTPPAFLLHTTDDKTVPVENSILFYQAMRNNNVPVEMHIFPTGGHGYGLAMGKGSLESWMDLCVEWVKRLVKN
jgi:acetyl esterase/lipase